MNFKNCSLMLLSTTLFLASCSKDGEDGKTMLTRTTKEAAGANCTYGGTKFETGIDANNNGTLEDTEVTTTQTKYVCDGEDGKTMLTRTTKEAAGANCTYGGTKFETGIDANNNGTLEDTEVTTTQTQYVCDGAGTIYSAWIDVNLIDNPYTIVAEDEFYYKQSLTATALTADVVNKGIVLMYYKDKSGMIVPVDRDDVYEILDVDASGNSFYFSAGFVFKQNYISFLVTAGDKSYLNDNGSAVRYVVVPGDTAGRSVSDLAKLPYSEVAKLYNIQD